MKLLAAGVPCGFTTAWPSWVHIENLSAVHDLPIATRQNGFGGLDTELTISNDVAVKHLTALAAWQKTRIFDYGGRADRADAKFHGSQCGMYVTSSATRPDILANAKFEVGYGLMPYWPDVGAAPQNSIIGGATLWVLKGRPEAEYKGVARFFAFLSRPEVQARWHQATGYLPITRAAYELSRAAGLLSSRNPGTDISIKQITLKEPTAEHQGPAHRLVRAGARRDRGRAGAGDRRQGHAQGGARFRSAARERDPAPVREGKSLNCAAFFPSIRLSSAAYNGQRASRDRHRPLLGGTQSAGSAGSNKQGEEPWFVASCWGRRLRSHSPRRRPPTPSSSCNGGTR